jgi:hypothetical protein
VSDYLLHEDATVMCTHTGDAKPQVTVSNVKVSGKAIVVQTSIYSISRCTLPTQSGGPCVTAAWTTAAQRIKARGIPVLLTSSKAKCVPTGVELNATITQTRAKGT